MKALLVLLLAAPLPAAAQDESWRGENEGQDRTKLLEKPQAQEPEQQGQQGPQEKEAYRKQKFEEDPNLPKDQGWRRIGVGGSPYADGVSVKPDPVPSLAPEEVRENVLTLLETHLARSGGRWVIPDPKTKRERSLKLAELGALKETKPGYFAAKARFKDASGALQAELVARVGGASWRIISLEPSGVKKPAAKKKPEPAPEGAVETMPQDEKAAVSPPPAPPPDPTPDWMSAPPPGR